MGSDSIQKMTLKGNAEGWRRKSEAYGKVDGWSEKNMISKGFPSQNKVRRRENCGLAKFLGLKHTYCNLVLNKLLLLLLLLFQNFNR